MYGNYYSILGLYRDNGKENGNYYLGFRVEGLVGFSEGYKYPLCRGYFQASHAEVSQDGGFVFWGLDNGGYTF